MAAESGRPQGAVCQGCGGGGGELWTFELAPVAPHEGAMAVVRRHPGCGGQMILDVHKAGELLLPAGPGQIRYLIVDNTEEDKRRRGLLE